LGPIKDVLLAMTYEFGENDTESYLIGPGFDLAIPGFDYFQLNFYQRHTEGSRVTTSGRSRRSGPTPFRWATRTS
jgi:nucleoside-specific outer membrane channel protein Tsx